MKTLIPFVIAACMAAPATAAPQASATVDPIGTWNVSFNTQQGVIPATLKLQKDGNKISGTIASAEQQGPVEAELNAKTLSVWFNYTANGQPIPVEMTGTIDGDSAKGTVKAGGNPSGDWTATRSKDTKDTKDTKEKGSSDVSGTWNASLQLDTISATPSFTLKQDGTKLTGEYVSQQYGKFPLSGEVTGTAVTFTVSMNIEGNAASVVYSGVLQADGSLKGSVDIGGGAMGGSFSATRKK